jgi:hypothetical protein
MSRQAVSPGCSCSGCGGGCRTGTPHSWRCPQHDLQPGAPGTPPPTDPPPADTEAKGRAPGTGTLNMLHTCKPGGLQPVRTMTTRSRRYAERCCRTASSTACSALEAGASPRGSARTRPACGDTGCAASGPALEVANSINARVQHRASRAEWWSDGAWDGASDVRCRSQARALLAGH